MTLANFIKPDDIIWREVKYLKLPLSADDDHADWAYRFELPEPLASWDVFSNWEKERTLCMAKNLRQGMMLYDVGTEQGWLNLAYAKMVRPENMVLIEPTPIFWPNIKQIWERNFTSKPFYNVPALVGEAEKGAVNITHAWPAQANGDIVDKNAYTYIHDNLDNVPMTTIDAIARATTPPDAITIDIEGAELLALKGAVNTLKTHQPLVFVSIHPDLGERDYDLKDEQVQEFLAQFGYDSLHLATDHEQHWFFYPKGYAVR